MGLIQIQFAEVVKIDGTQLLVHGLDINPFFLREDKDLFNDLFEDWVDLVQNGSIVVHIRDGLDIFLERLLEGAQEVENATQ